jgi:hypothetical protein
MNQKDKEVLMKRGNAIVATAMFVGLFALPTYVGFFFTWEVLCLVAWAYNRFSKQNVFHSTTEHDDTEKQNVTKIDEKYVPPWEDPVFRERLDPLSLENLYVNSGSLTKAE